MKVFFNVFLALLFVTSVAFSEDIEEIKHDEDGLVFGITVPLAPIPLIGLFSRHFLEREGQNTYADTTQLFGLSFIMTSSEWGLQLNYQHASAPLVFEGPMGFEDKHIRQDLLNTSFVFRMFDISVLNFFLGPDFLFYKVENDYNDNANFIGGGAVFGLNLQEEHEGLTVDGFTLSVHLNTNFNDVVMITTLQGRSPAFFNTGSLPLGLNLGIEGLIGNEYKYLRVFVELGITF